MTSQDTQQSKTTTKPRNHPKAGKEKTPAQKQPAETSDQATETPAMPEPRRDIQQLVTDTIIAQLETGTVPWQKPWAEKRSVPFTLPKNAVTATGYHGINIVLLWSAGLKSNFPTQQWASFNQWKSKKETIRKGEKGTMVVYYDTFEKDVDGEIHKIPYLKHYHVFNRSQLESFQPDKDEIEVSTAPSFLEKLDEVDEFVAATKAAIECHDGGASYHKMEDKIYLPFIENFRDTPNCTSQEGFYATLFHELSHWTGAKERLDRINHKRFGDSNYAAEELTAEFSAAFLCAGFGIATLDKGNHSAYIENWLQVLKNDKTVLFTASSAASKAVDYLYRL